MKIPKMMTAAVTAFVVWGVATDLAAKSSKPAPRNDRAYQPVTTISRDSEELAVLAPPSPDGTAVQTYGDAPFARSREQRRYERQVAFCASSPTACADGPPGTELPLGYGQYYEFTPANATAPQVNDDPTRQTSLLSPMTSIFLSGDALRFDPH